MSTLAYASLVSQSRIDFHSVVVMVLGFFGMGLVEAKFARSKESVLSLHCGQSHLP